MATSDPRRWGWEQDVGESSYEVGLRPSGPGVAHARRRRGCGRAAVEVEVAWNTYLMV